MTADGTTYSEAASCNGQDEYIMQNLFCTVPMDTLINDPFSLAQDTLIQVRISGANSLGLGIYSTLNTVGVTAKTKPY